MDLSDLETLDAKMHVLESFVGNLRKAPENKDHTVLAAAVERILQTGSSEEIVKAFAMCEEKFDKV
jgi:hypothetical protein